MHTAWVLDEQISLLWFSSNSPCEELCTTQFGTRFKMQNLNRSLNCGQSCKAAMAVKKYLSIMYASSHTLRP